MKDILFTAFFLIISVGYGVAHGADASGYGYPGHPGYGYPRHQGYNFGRPPAFSGAPMAQGMRLERGVTDEGYFLKIHLGGMEPHTINVKAQGRSLVIDSSQSIQTEEQDTQAGYGYYRSYRSSGAMQRRISLPHDADLEKMQRSDGEGYILITLPRITDI